MNRALKVVLVCGVALSVTACASARRLVPFGLGGGQEEPAAVASAGTRISVLDLEQRLAPAADLAGRDFLLPLPQAVTSWTQPGGTVENLVEHVDAAPEFAVGWRRNIGKGSSRLTQVMSPIVAADGKIFVMDGDHTVSAVDATNGNIVWNVDIRPEGHERGGFGGGLAVAGGKVFVASGQRIAVALDAATGATLWSRTVEVPIHGAPTVAGGRMYVVDVDNQLIAFDVNTGNPVWTYRAIAEPARIMRASSPAVTGDAVIAPFSSGEVIALRATNGQSLWQQVLSRTSRTSALSEIRDIAGRPVISRGMVYAISHSGILTAMDLRSGEPKWEIPIAGVNAPLPVGDAVYVVSKAGELTVVNRETGAVYWNKNLNEGRIRQEGGFFGILDRTVRPEWAGPILASNRLILVNSDGQAVAYNPKTGEQLAQIKLGGAVYVAPIAYNGVLYALTDDGELVSIR